MTQSISEKLFAIKNSILISAAEVHQYKSWKDGFARNNIEEAFTKSADRIGKITVDELRQLSKDELYQHGFGNWDGTLVLLPIWFYDFIADGEELISIMGNVTIVGKDHFDTDHRGGFLAYGFNL